MTDNIPPEPHDDIRAWRIECGSLIAKLSMASCFDKPRLALAMKIDEAVDRMRRPAPAPARISPEVRETILRALSLVLGESMMESYEVYPAIAFVEALP